MKPIKAVIFGAILYFILFFGYITITFKYNDKKCWNDINFKKTEEILATQSIKNKILIENNITKKLFAGKSSNIFLLTFKNNLKAIFRPISNNLSIASLLLNYHFSELMGFKFIPPTVIRTVDGQKGSIQLFVNNISNYYQQLKSLDLKTKNNLYVFYFMFGLLDHSEIDIIVGKNCNQPALFDINENMGVFLSITQYGDFPYLKIPHPYKKDKLIFFDYVNLPFKNVKSIPYFSSYNFQNLKQIFPYINLETADYGFSKKSTPDDLIEDTLHYIEWKERFWMQMNPSEMKHIYKDFVPKFIQKETMDKLKKIDINKLNSLMLIVLPYLNEEEKQEIINQIKILNELSIYRKNLILKKFK